MESYEEFCSRRLDGLHAGNRCTTQGNHRGAMSTIQFHGKHVLLPKLSEHQRLEIAEQRQKAMERDRERGLLRKKRHEAHDEVQQDVDSAPLVTQAPPSCRTLPDREASPTTLVSCYSSHAWRKETLRLLNSRMERPGEEEGMSGAQNNKEREETFSHKDNETCSVPECTLQVESGSDFTSADLSCSVESQSSGSLPAGLSLCASLMGSYAQLPSPQPSCSSPAQCSRGPPPHLPSPAHILISVPVSGSELAPHGPGGTRATQYEPDLSRSPSSRITVQVEQSGSSECLMRPPSGGQGNCTCSELSGNMVTSTPRGSVSVTPRRPVTLAHTSPTTQPGPALKREKSRQHNSAPYLRSPPAPLNQSYDVENPSPSPLRPQVSSGLESSTAPLHRKLVPGGWPQHPQEDWMNAKKEKETQHHLQHRALCRLTATARGFLTRRLLQTEKIQHLRKTIQDSRELIRCFQSDANQRRASFTPHDLCLQRRVRAQLRMALCSVHEIFFLWPVREKLVLLQHNRELQNERRLREMEKAKSPCDRPSVSSATQKSLDRRRQIQSRKILQTTKTLPERVPQSAQAQNAVIFPPKFKAARVVRRTVESFRSRLSLG